MTQAAMD